MGTTDSRHIGRGGPQARLALVCLAAVLVLVSGAPLAAQCAMCRQALDSPEGRQMIGALREGIYVLLVAPFALFGTIAFLATRTLRRKPSSATPR